MGYYAGLTVKIGPHVKVDTQKLMEMAKKYSDPNRSDVYGYYDVEFEVDNDELKNIVLKDYYAKFYDDSMFAKDLSKAIISGQVDLYYQGEDGEWWGYRITHERIRDLVMMIVEHKHFDECWEHCKKISDTGTKS